MTTAQRAMTLPTNLEIVSEEDPRSRTTRALREDGSLDPFGNRTLLCIGDGVVTTDCAARITFLNPAAEELTGWSRAEAKGRYFDEVFPLFDADGAKIECPIVKTLRAGHTIVLEGQPLLTRRDGTRIAIADSAAPLQLEDGTVTGVVLVFRDASLQRREAARQTLFARVGAELGSCFDLENSLQRVAEMIAECTKGCCSITLLEQHESGRTIARADAGPTNGDSSAVTFSTPLHSQGERVGSMMVVLHGAEREHGEIDGATLVELAERISTAIENVFLYREAQHLRRVAESASRTKDEFLAMLGHELRNPLAPIVTALDLMRRRGAAPFERELSIIERQLRHVVRLVDDLLDVSRITRGRIQLRCENIDIADVVRSAVERAQPLIEERQHSIVIEAPRGLFVCGDLDRLTQAIANLLINAAKYTPQGGGLIRVSAARENDRLVVRVRDNGMGIAPEVRERIFDLFVQDPRTLDRSQGGLGIGLAVVRAIVRGHGGEVSATSEGLGEGTEFVIALPAPADACDMHPPSVDGPTGSSGRLLIVDDNADAAELLAASLALLGYETHEAHDASSALAIARRVKPMAALLDIGLPVVDGYELARRLRATEHLEHIQLIAVTGYGQPGARDRSRAAGFDAHLVKPVPIDAVARLLERERSTGGDDGRR